MSRGTIVFLSGAVVALGCGWYAFPRVLYSRASQPIQFSHQVHTGEKGGMKCDDCHSLRADGTFSGVPVLEKCSSCHAAVLGVTADEKTLVDRYVTPNHEIPWKVYSRQPDNAFFSHAYHVTLAKIACAECHGQHGTSDRLRDYQQNRLSGYSRDIWGPSISRIPVRGRPGMKMSDCEKCHEQRGVKTGCLGCHK